MEEGNDGALELGSLLSTDGDGGEGSPQDVLANVSGDEEGDT